MWKADEGREGVFSLLWNIPWRLVFAWSGGGFLAGKVMFPRENSVLILHGGNFPEAKASSDHSRVAIAEGRRSENNLPAHLLWGMETSVGFICGNPASQMSPKVFLVLCSRRGCVPAFLPEWASSGGVPAEHAGVLPDLPLCAHTRAAGSWRLGR